MKMVGRARCARVLAAMAAVVVTAMGLSPVWANATATAQVVAPEDCPEALATDEVTRGMTGTGFTVSQGTEPEPFSVEVLGVLRDGVAPGRDMIVVDTSSPAIEEAGGIWFGMSGSPVYDSEGRLMGAVAFGLSGGPSSIGGLTPAEDLFDLLDYPSGVAPTSRKSVALSGGVGRRVDARTKGDSSGSTMKRLRAPLSVSGMTPRALEVLDEAIRREGRKYVVTQGSSSQAAEPGTELGTMGAGDTFAAALSYGDITMGAIGTAALVCEGQSVAFGHPFSFGGRTYLGANVGDTHTIVNDPLFGPYKLADITEPVGIVDQDRLAGVRALLGVAPETRPVRSTVSAPDIGRVHDGESRAVTDGIVPQLGFFHLFSNIDSTFDSVGKGSSRVSWTVTGTTEDGDPWALARSNVYSSRYDISMESSFELFDQLAVLLGNKFTSIDFDSVDVEATVTEERSGYRITKLLHSTNNRKFSDGRRVRVRPGSKLFLRAKLTPIGGGRTKTVPLQFKIRRDFRRGFIEVGGDSQGGGFFCFEDMGGCGSSQKGVDSFDELINNLENAPKGNDLTATFSERRTQRRKTARLDGVVSGLRFLHVDAGKGGGGGKTVSLPHK